MAMEPFGVREIVTCQQVLLDHGVFAFLWHRSSKAFLLKLAVRTGFDHVHTMGQFSGLVLTSPHFGSFQFRTSVAGFGQLKSALVQPLAPCGSNAKLVIAVVNCS